METQKYRVTRVNPGINTTIPCEGGIDFWPINTSSNCAGLNMYQSTGSQIINALDYDMGNFPLELRDCSLSNPCVILWDTVPTSNQTHCTNIGGYSYVKFTGLKLTSGLTTYNQSYNDFVPAIYDINNLTTSKSLKSQIGGGFLDPTFVPCGCSNAYLNSDLYKLTTLLTQDINDIGHYSIWDGNIAQKEVFANFVYSGDNNGWGVQLWNTTDFGYYPSLQDSEYIINWGDSNIETLQYPQLKSTHIYCGPQNCPPQQYAITITHQTPWGPVSSTKVITIPYKDYIGLLVEPYVPSVSWTGGTGLGQQQFMYTHTPPGTTASTTSIAYHTMYPTTPLDSGTHILQYSGTARETVENTELCFTVSGVTDSMLGSFKQYTGTTNSIYLPGGYREQEEVSIAGDVLDPILNNYVPGILGMINSASPSFTAYTLYSYVNQRTPIDFYDFPDGITIFIAESCGLNALAFSDDGCFECLEDDCLWCLTKDEYIDRVTLQTVDITFNKATEGEWNNYTDYIQGDIVFDKSFNDCCCYMLVHAAGVTQLGGSPSEFAGIPPALSPLGEGIMVSTTLNPIFPHGVHVWEACSPNCVSCPAGSITPCADTSIASLWWDATYANTTTYTVDDYVQTLNGCYQPKSNAPTIHPTADTSNTFWDYIGCVSWDCPQLSAPPAPIPTDCIRIPGGTGAYMIWDNCQDDLVAGDCYNDRWLCENQFDCGACTKIPPTHPDWGDISATGPAFALEPDCIAYCKPPVWVCSARTQTPCCKMVTCNDVNVLYTTILNPGVINAIKGVDFDYGVITSGILGLDFHLTQGGCAGPGDGSACCDFTNYNWSCEGGCEMVQGPGTYANLNECQSDPHGFFIDAGGSTYPYLSTSNDYNTTNSLVLNICGWECQLGGVCTPCYQNGCSLWSDPNICNQNCSGATECHRCNCGVLQNCQLETPCQTMGSVWNGTGTEFEDPADYSPTTQFGADPVNLNGGGYSYETDPDCLTNCPCDSGWDCWIDIHASSQAGGVPTNTGGCTLVSNSIYLEPGMLSVSGMTASEFGPYSSHTACCEATACCLVRCDDEFPSLGGASPIPYGDWPCMYIGPLSSGAVDGDGNPILAGQCVTYWDAFIPFCTMSDCHLAVLIIPTGTGDFDNTGIPLNGNEYCEQGVYAGGYIDVTGTVIPGAGTSVDDWCLACPGTAETATETCECACGPNNANLGLGANNIDRGPWITSNIFYTYGDTVSYMDATNPMCCYTCLVYSSDTPTIEHGIPRQCGIHSPADGPSFNAPNGALIVNAWQSCNLMPSGSTSPNLDGCTACGLVLGNTWSCQGGLTPPAPGPAGLAGGWTSGCILNAMGACVPPMDSSPTIQLELQTAANCFTSYDCNQKCQAACFCEAGGNPFVPGTSDCVTNQQYDANIANDPDSYGDFNSTFVSFGYADLNYCYLGLLGGYDCCGNPRYNCLSGHTCTDDSAIQTTQLAEMFPNLDACVPLWPSDMGYGDAQFRDQTATASTFTDGLGNTIYFLATGNQTAAYNMCSYYCRWGCGNYTTPNGVCTFIGSDPAELALAYHVIYNPDPWDGSTGFAFTPSHTSAAACRLGGLIFDDCFCNTDWVSCVVQSDTTVVTMGYLGANPVTNVSTCICSASSTGIYHTIDECENPQNYTNVPVSCCDNITFVSWCLANTGALDQGCDNTNVILDAEIMDISTNALNTTVTDYTTNSGGTPVEVLIQEYTNPPGGFLINISPNLMFTLQMQIANIVMDGTQVNKLLTPFVNSDIMATQGTECVEPNIPITTMMHPGWQYQYGWGGDMSDCCFTPEAGNNHYIAKKVRTITHEYLIHANYHLPSFLGQLPYDDNYPFDFHYSNINILLSAATTLGVTGLTRSNPRQGWSVCDQCFSGTTVGGTDDYYLTDVDEIAYQISEQYYGRIFPAEHAGEYPPPCVQGEQYLPYTSSTTTSSTHTACVTLKTLGCCRQPCFCSDNGVEFAWTNGASYESQLDPLMTTGTVGSATIQPFILDFSLWGPAGAGGGINTEAYGDGYISNSSCLADGGICCGQVTGGLVYGCTDKQAFNFDCTITSPATGVPCLDGVNIDDGSCYYITGPGGPPYCIWGCMDAGANNYEPNATCFSACTY